MAAKIYTDKDADLVRSAGRMTWGSRWAAWRTRSSCGGSTPGRHARQMLGARQSQRRGGGPGRCRQRHWKASRARPAWPAWSCRPKPSTMTAFMPKHTAPSRRALARKLARMSPGS
jgi:hypothetical protein